MKNEEKKKTNTPIDEGELETESNGNVDSEQTAQGVCEDYTDAFAKVLCKYDDLNEKYLKLTAENEDLNERYLRLSAEYDNFRKRSQKEKITTYTDAYNDAFLLILPIIDNIDRAVEFACDDGEVSKGVKMLKTQSEEALQKAGIEEIKSLGEQFDPALHNAIMHNKDEETPANTITQVFLKGYKKDDKVIRHALVAVTN